jgi:hypothetical protein
MAESDDAGYVIEGPDVAIVGWIPYAFDLDDMAENAFTRHRHRHGFGWLFDSGNPDPPGRFEGHAGFLEFLQGKEFRGACCLRDVRLRCDRDGVPLGIAYHREEYVGYTPYRWANKKTRHKLTAHHGLGQGKFEVRSLISDSPTVAISLHFSFRVGTFGNFGAWFLTGKQAPWVNVGLDYFISTEGRIRAILGGSFIPSHRYYVDWSACGDHDMLGVEAAAIDSFLATGRDEKAAGNFFATWNGEGRRC